MKRFSNLRTGAALKSPGQARHETPSHKEAQAMPSFLEEVTFNQGLEERVRIHQASREQGHCLSPRRLGVA